MHSTKQQKNKWKNAELWLQEQNKNSWHWSSLQTPDHNLIEHLWSFCPHSNHPRPRTPPKCAISALHCLWAVLAEWGETIWYEAGGFSAVAHGKCSKDVVQLILVSELLSIFWTHLGWETSRWVIGCDEPTCGWGMRPSSFCVVFLKLGCSLLKFLISSLCLVQISKLVI